MKEILIGGALLVGLSVTLLELFPEPDDAIVLNTPAPIALPETAARVAQATSNTSTPTGPQQALEPNNELVERDPDAIQSQTDLFRAVAKPPPEPVKPLPIPVVIPAVPKPPFVFMGTVIQDTERQAIVLNGEQVSILKRGDSLAGFQIESIDERNLALIHQSSASKVLLAAKAIQ